MLNHLLESRAVRTRRTGGSVVSLIVHATLITAAVIATGNAGVADAPKEQLADLQFTTVQPTPPPPPMVASPRVYAAPTIKGFQLLQAPLEIPDVLPDIDLTRPPTNADDFSARGRPGGRADGDPNASSPVPSNGVYADFQVEKPVALVPGAFGPQYPEVLRAAGIEGQVLAQFVVDTIGRADVSTFIALRSDNVYFTNAVRSALPRMRFIPAEVDGRRVAQLVQQPFQFSVSR